MSEIAKEYGRALFELAREDGIEDENHQVITSNETDQKTGEQVQKRIQLEKRESDNARLFRLGFTLEEAEQLVS